MVLGSGPGEGSEVSVPSAAAQTPHEGAAADGALRRAPAGGAGAAEGPDVSIRRRRHPIRVLRPASSFKKELTGRGPEHECLG